MMYKYQCVHAEFFPPLNAILFLYCMEILEIGYLRGSPPKWVLRCEERILINDGHVDATEQQGRMKSQLGLLLSLYLGHP